MSETQISKWDFKPIYVSQKCPQNAGNAVSETQSLKNYNCVVTMASPSLKFWLRHWLSVCNVRLQRKICSNKEKVRKKCHLVLAFTWYRQKNYTKTAENEDVGRSGMKWKQNILFGFQIVPALCKRGLMLKRLNCRSVFIWPVYFWLHSFRWMEYLNYCISSSTSQHDF